MVGGFNSRYARYSGFYPGLQLIRHGPPQQPTAVMAVATVAGSDSGSQALGVSSTQYPAPYPYAVAPVAISPAGYAPVASAPAPMSGGVEMTAPVYPASAQPSAPAAPAPAPSGGGIGSMFGYPAVQKREF